MIVIDEDESGSPVLRDNDLCGGLVPLTKVASDIDVVTRPHPTETGKHQATVNDRVHQRSWSGEGNTSDSATTEAVRKFLGDRHAGEYVPR
jgi:hypothetical protein